MIVFNGNDLQDIAPVKIDDIHVSPIQVNAVARQRFGIGQDFVRMTGPGRKVTVTFALLDENKDQRWELLQDIKAWADPYKQHILSLPMFTDRHLDVICTGFPDPSYRQWWENKMTLVFETFENPYWTSDEEIRATCGTPFSIGGNAPPLIRIERKLTSRIANQTYASNGRSMFFSQIPAGNMKIDLNNQTAEVSGTSIMQYFGVTSKYIEPVTGNQNITGIGTIYYRERWV